MNPDDAPARGDRLEHRGQAVYAAAIGVTIVAGLASRKFGHVLPAEIRKQTGDVLWATMVFFLFGLLLPRLSGMRVALVAVVFSVIIESSKFLHPAWLDALRDNPAGRLVFGYVFSWSNLICYLLGIGLGLCVERGLLLRYSIHNTKRHDNGK